MKDSYQTTNYLVCTSERSGSGLLCNLLKNTGLAGTTISEILHQDHSGTISSVEELRGYLAQSYEMSRTANGVSGCKVHWLHIERISKQINISTDEVISCFPKDIQYIYLKRNDPIKQAISLYIAQRTGQWKKEVSDAKEVFDMTKIDFLQIHLNVKLLCEENNGWSNFFSKNKLVHQRVDYENLINDHQGIALGLLNFLKINYPANINIHT
ncbi:MAG: Stf0 family sulfotransferase, partial [bacterium]